MGALFAPLGLMALVYGRRKKGSKWAVLLVILSFAVVTGLTLSGCGNDNPPVGEFTATGTFNPVTGTATGTLTTSGGTFTGTVVGTPGAPLVMPISCPAAPILTPTSIRMLTSGYYIPTESQAREYGGGLDIPIPAPDWAGADLYLAQNPTPSKQFSHNWAEDLPQKANEFLLYDHDYTCLQGSGKLDNGGYITCQNPDKLWWSKPAYAGDSIRERVSFLWADTNQTGLITSLNAFNTVAVCPGSQLQSGDKIQLVGLVGDPMKKLQEKKNTEAIFTVVDVGEGLCPQNSIDGKSRIDIFTGEGAAAYYDAVLFFDQEVQVIKR